MRRLFFASLFLSCLVPIRVEAQSAGQTYPDFREVSSEGNGWMQEPTEPPARTVRDARTHTTTQLPAGWNLSRSDGELSTFRLDARTATRRTDLAFVADLGFNPYPRSTFSGALFYLSSTPRSTAAECLAQAARGSIEPVSKAIAGDVTFARGKDAQGKMCTEARDTVYTAMRHGSCIRFDLVINSFCGGEASGAVDMTQEQLANIQGRLEGILQTVRFGGP